MRRGLLCFALLSAFSSASAEDYAFDINQLDRGTDVTLPHPATTLVPFNTLHRVIPTDYDQVLKLTSTVPSCSVQVSVYDRAAPYVRKLEVKGGDILIYRFAKLTSIMVNSEARGGCQKMAKLMLESNRPLGVGL